MTVKKFATRLGVLALALSVSAGTFSGAAANATSDHSVAQAAAAVSADRIGTIPAPTYANGVATFPETFSAGNGNTTYTSDQMINNGTLVFVTSPTAYEWQTSSGQVLTAGSTIDFGGKIWTVSSADTFGLTLVAPADVTPVSAKTPVVAPEAPAFVVKSGIARTRDSLGGVSRIGDPTMNEAPIGGGVYQEFKTPSGKVTTIYWKSGAGSYATHGGIRSKMNSLGGASAVGFPTMNERSLGDRVYQEFRTSKGKMTNIYWKSGVGTHPVTGGIRSKMLSMGGSGATGVPVTGEYSSGAGKVSQKFQKGTITWQSGKATSFVKR